VSVTCDRSVVFSAYSGFSSTNKTERHDITEILLKVAFNTINQMLSYCYSCGFYHGKQLEGKKYTDKVVI
jgi:anaerobic ribonucleoside-triphosphate reductase